MMLSLCSAAAAIFLSCSKATPVTVGLEQRHLGGPEATRCTSQRHFSAAPQESTCGNLCFHFVPPLPSKDKDVVHTFISWRMALRSVSPGSLNISHSCLYWKYLQRREHGLIRPSDSAFHPNVRVTSDSLCHRVGLLSGLLAHHWSDD